MSRNNIIGNSECPSCVSKGGDRTGDHLMLFEDGGAYCNRCGYHEKTTTFTKPSKSMRDSKTPEDIKADIDWVIDNSKVSAVRARHLKLFACKYYGVRTGVSESDGVTPLCMYYPITAAGNKGTQGYLCKTIPGEGVDKRAWSKGEGKGAMFFGSDVVPKNGFRLFITEGQDDAVALYQAMYEKSEEKYKSRLAVVSLQNGAGSAASEMARNAELISNYKEIVLCFDMDAAGEEAVSKALTVLPREKVRVAKYSKLDANDMVKAGLIEELYWAVIKAGEARPEKIKLGSDISFDKMFKPLKKGLETPYPGLNSKLRGLRHGPKAGELTVVAAAPGFGKTTLLRELMYDLLNKHEVKVGSIFLEESNEKTALSMIAIDKNIPLPELRLNPDLISDADKRDAYDRLINNGRYAALEHWGSLASPKLMDHMNYLSKEVGCSFIQLDHISLVVSGQESSKSGERKDLDLLMTKLAAFVEESGTSVMAVVHLSRPDKGSFNEGRRITLRDMRGSAAIEQLAHNVLVIEGDQAGDNPNGRTIGLLKSREWGDLGHCGDLTFHKDIGRLLPNDIETKFIPNGGAGMRGI